MSMMLPTMLVACGGSSTGVATGTDGSRTAADATLVVDGIEQHLSSMAIDTADVDQPTLLAETAVVGTTSTASQPVATAPLAPAVTCGLSNFQQQILNEINKARVNGRYCGSKFFPSAPPLAWNAKLAAAAAGNSADMASKNYFSHTSRDGRTFVQRISAAGYTWQAAAENIAAGQTTIEQVVNGWVASPGHCTNIMNPVYVDVAVACVRNDAAAYRRYWTMDMARPR